METVTATPPLAERDRLDSWKEIAAYLQRSERTVRRWEETEGLPVHRHLHRKRGTVLAYKSEIDRWWHDRRARLVDGEETGKAAEPSSPPRFARHRLGWTLTGLTLSTALAGALFLATTLPIAPVAVSSSPVKGIAILPLRNESGDPAQDFFADGMTEALIAEVGRIEGLRVIARSSVLRYRDGRQTTAAIATALGVEAVVEGTVLRDGSRVRIALHLNHAREGGSAWSDSYEFAVERLLDLQRTAALGIARALRVDAKPESTSLPAMNVEAYDLYLRGVLFLDSVTKQGFESALEHFHRSISIDPTFAPAYVGLADAYNRSAIEGYRSPREAYPRARKAAEQALALDDTLAEAHTLMAVIRFRWEWDWEAAERALQRARSINERSSRVRVGYSTYLLMRGRFAEAVDVAKQTVLDDPLSPQRNGDLAFKLRYARDYAGALDQLDRTLQLVPDFPRAYVERALTLTALDRADEAVAACRRAIALAPESQTTLGGCGRVFGQSGAHDDAMRVVMAFDRLSPEQRVDPYQAARVYDALGDTARALALLRRAYDERSPNLAFFAIDTEWSDGLRRDPRSQQLLRQLAHSAAAPS